MFIKPYNLGCMSQLSYLLGDWEAGQAVEGDSLNVGRASLQNLDTSGHTPDGISLVANDRQGHVERI